MAKVAKIDFSKKGGKHTDFVKIAWRMGAKKGAPPEIYPDFLTGESKDLMVRGGDFYAIWDEEKGRWSTNQNDIIRMIDSAMDEYKKSNIDTLENAKVLYMRYSRTGTIDEWVKYIKRQQLSDSFHPLDDTLVFADAPIRREDYSSKRLGYSLKSGDHKAWDELVGTLYSPEEQHKIEWAIGAVISGDSRFIQKFLVFYGDSGTGKSTVLHIIEKLFDGYYAPFDAKALGSGSNDFALEPLKNNPLVAIQHDGDLSRIEDNTKLNSLVSHEELMVNTKYGKMYPQAFHTMLFLGTNKPVKITDSKSGIIRRLIDVSPTGKLIPMKRYLQLNKSIDFELGAIAEHCLRVYEEDPHYYDNYIPQIMVGATNDFYNYMEEYFDTFKEADSTTLNDAWFLYNTYVSEAKVPYPYSKRVFKEELKNYFRIFKERQQIDGKYLRNWYGGLKLEKFGIFEKQAEEEAEGWLKFNTTESLFDKYGASWPAQLAYIREDGSDQPSCSWDKCETCLADINTSELHYVRTPESIITVDFDKKDPVTGEKSLKLNLEAASKWPETYAELSKSGVAIHLEYIYTGDVNKLSPIYEKDVEIKVFPKDKKSSLRRKLTRCNDIPIATISSGLPLKKEVKLVEEYVIEDEKHLRSKIKKALRKEVEPGFTVTCVNYIQHVLDQAYESGMHYDVSDMYKDIYYFAASSHNHSLELIDKVQDFHYKSEDASTPVESKSGTIVFIDFEVFPNLIVLCVKPINAKPYSLINPTSKEVLDIFNNFNVIGFNNRDYDNHIAMAIIMGETIYEVFVRSQSIIGGVKGRNEYKIREAYNLSYTDVYDFCAKKQSLKKWEIELGIHHQELGLPWDKPVPKDRWKQVADYCINDVVATEAVFLANQADFKARQILVDLANTLVGPGSTVNDTTNTLTTKLIVGNEKNPQAFFNYPDLSKEFPGYEYSKFGIDRSRYISKDVIISGKSIYKGYDPGEGGFVYAEPGMYGYSECYDSASHHPSSIIAENGFGPYTPNFKRLLDLRLMIKHKQFDEARQLYDGALAPYLTSEEDAKALSYALKIAINSVYGLTAAHFDNKLHDPRNIDNWVAKRGALFMIDLLTEVQKRGYKVIHVKTDSIKIDHPDKKIFDFIYDYGKKFGYTFEVEHKFDRLCLVNDAVYICKYTDDPENGKAAGQWEGTGDQFKKASNPYVFKTLFSHEPIEFKDLCVTQTVKVGLGLYLDMDENLNDTTGLEKEEDKLLKKWSKVGFELTDENDKTLSDGFAPRLTDIPSKKAEQYSEEYYHSDYVRLCEIREEIKKCHDYHFVGKAGLFCPMKPGTGGGRLVRENNGKFAYAAGSKGYRWMEAEYIQKFHKENDIDLSYFEKLAEDAKATVNKFGSFDEFAG